MTHEALAVAISLVNIVITIIAVGRSFGQVTTRLETMLQRIERLEKTMGNGEPGAFVRRTEWMIMNDRRSNEIAEMRAQLLDIQRRWGNNA